VKTRKKTDDIPVDGSPTLVAFTPDGKTGFVSNGVTGTVSTIDVKTRKKTDDIAVGSGSLVVALTPDGKTAFVTNNQSGTVSTIDVKTRKKDPGDIPTGSGPFSRCRSHRTARPRSSPTSSTARCRPST
jgi:YVTN family beta-propeller protein